MSIVESGESDAISTIAPEGQEPVDSFQNIYDYFALLEGVGNKSEGLTDPLAEPLTEAICALLIPSLYTADTFGAPVSVQIPAAIVDVATGLALSISFIGACVPGSGIDPIVPSVIATLRSLPLVAVGVKLGVKSIRDALANLAL